MTIAFSELKSLVDVIEDIGLLTISGEKPDTKEFHRLLEADNRFRAHAKQLVNEVVALYRIKHAADELAALKKLKDEKGKTAEYLKRKDKAWKELFDAQEMFDKRKKEG